MDEELVVIHFYGKCYHKPVWRYSKVTHTDVIRTHCSNHYLPGFPGSMLVEKKRALEILFIRPCKRCYPEAE